MRKIIRFIISILIIINIVNGFVFAEHIIEKRIIRIGGDNNYPPYEFVDDDGNFRGFNVDIMNAVAIELGIEIDLKSMSWAEAMLRLESGELDLVQGMTKSSYREGLFDFSEPLIINSQAIFVKKDSTDVAVLNDLIGKKVSFQEADISMEIASSLKNIDRFPRENQEEAIQLLLNGDVDAFVGNRYTGIYYLQKTNNYKNVKMVGAPMHETQYCSAVKKDNDELLELFNKGIKAIKANGTYDKIYNKWFGEAMPSNIESLRKTLRFVIIVTMAIMIITSIILYINRKLKLKVRERTRELDNINKELSIQKDKVDLSNILRGTILSSIVSGIIVFDDKDKIIEFNSAAEELIDCELKIGDSWKKLDLENRLNIIGFDKANDGSIVTDNITLKNSDIELYLNYNFIPIEDNGIILLINDYTEIENYQKMASYNEKIQALGQLSAGIAHEIRNPLTSIKAFIDLIPYKIDDEDFRRELVEITSKEIVRMDDLIVQLIEMTKPVNHVMGEYSLEKAINEVLLLFSNNLAVKKINLISEIEDVIVFGDINQFKQIIVNLLLNSIEAIEENGEIKITGKCHGDYIEIRIEDNGIGISKEDIDKIFNPFFTLKPKGTGIGLAMTSKLIDENKGSINIKSKEGIGTVVIIRLPV